MLPTDRPKFLKVLNGLAAIKGKDLTTEALELWWKAMSRWSVEEFTSAASHLVSSCQFMPSPYDFEQLRKAGRETSSEAWALALSKCSTWRGACESPGGRIDRAVKMIGGYHAIAMTQDKDLPFLAKRFKDAYEELGEVEDVREALPQLTNDNALTDKTAKHRDMTALGNLLKSA